MQAHSLFAKLPLDFFPSLTPDLVQVRVACFDKTGTLTTSGQVLSNGEDMVEVVVSSEADDPHAGSRSYKNPASEIALNLASQLRSNF